MEVGTVDDPAERPGASNVQLVTAVRGKANATAERKGREWSSTR
jgi:hypothetical protein